MSLALGAGGPARRTTVIPIIAPSQLVTNTCALASGDVYWAPRTVPMQGNWSARYDELGTLTHLRKFNFTAIAVLRRRLPRLKQLHKVSNFMYGMNVTSQVDLGLFLMVMRTIGRLHLVHHAQSTGDDSEQGWDSGGPIRKLRGIVMSVSCSGKSSGYLLFPCYLCAAMGTSAGFCVRSCKRSSAVIQS
jgi:hypothetical protein